MSTSPPPFARLARIPGVALLWRERWWLVAFAALLTLCRLPTVDGWDDAFYVGQLTSALGDRDLRLQDDVVSVPKDFAEKCRVLTTVLPSGALANTFSIGPALVLSPFTIPFVSADSPPPWLAFRAAAALAALSLLLATAIVCARMVERFGVGKDVARLAAGLGLLGGPLAIYATRGYLSAHAWGGLLVALTLHQSLAWVDSRRPRHAVALGLAAGFACVNRWQDAVIVAPVVLAAVVVAARSREPWRAGAVLATLSALLVGASQLLAFQIQFGTPFLIPQGGDYMRWLSPAIVPLVFSSYHGLLPWAPALALGFVALALGLRRGTPHRWLLGAVAAGGLLAVYVSACPQDWWGRNSYGPRRLASLAPIATLGLGLLLTRLKVRWRVLFTLAIGAWATLTLSAHFSRHDDLLLLLTGRPDPFHPAMAPTDTGPRWIDSWGPLHALKPGFSFSDAPHLPDRLIGIAFVTLVVVAVRLLLPLLVARVRAQQVVVGAATVLAGAWVVLLATMPSNREWDRQWKAFLEAPLEEASALPRQMAVPGDVVLAARASERGEVPIRDAALKRLREHGVVATATDAARCRAPR